MTRYIIALLEERDFVARPTSASLRLVRLPFSPLRSWAQKRTGERVAGFLYEQRTDPQLSCGSGFVKPYS
jgi:hypothetical protein